MRTRLPRGIQNDAALDLGALAQSLPRSQLANWLTGNTTSNRAAREQGQPDAPMADPPAWMYGQNWGVNSTDTSELSSEGEGDLAVVDRPMPDPPAWMQGGQEVIITPQPSAPQLPWPEGAPPAPAAIPSLPQLPAITLPSLPSTTDPIVIPPITIPGLGTIPSITLPAPSAPSVVIPSLPALPAITPPVTAPQPSAVPATGGWRVAVLTALQTVGTEMSNSQFLSWATAPRDIFALALSESGGKTDAVKNEGHSSKLGRSFYSFGLFQINELYAQGHYANARAAVGLSVASTMLPFPSGANWTKEQAAIPLTAWPGQLGYAMVLLRGLSRYKNTWFTKCDATDITPATGAGSIKDPAELQRAKDTALHVKKHATRLGISPSGILTKAFWLASSPGGVLTLVRKDVEPRLDAYARHWKASAT